MPGSKLLPMCACAWICHCSTNGINTYSTHTQTPAIHELNIRFKCCTLTNIPHVLPHVQTHVSQPKRITACALLPSKTCSSIPQLADCPPESCTQGALEATPKKMRERGDHFEAEHFRVRVCQNMMRDVVSRNRVE